MTQHAQSKAQILPFSSSNHPSATPPRASSPSSSARRQAAAPAWRRDYLLRRKLELEMEVQDMLAQLDSLDDEQLALEAKRTALQQQVPALKKQVALAGLLSKRQTAAERVFAYQVQRFAQEQDWIAQQKIRCSHRLNAANVKLDLVDRELDLLL